MTDQNLPLTVNAVHAQLAWRTSSYSGNNGGQCVEAAFRIDVTTPDWLLRDSKDPYGPVLTFSPAEWGSFIANVKADQLDAN